jgi:hypothetical protein
MSKRSGVLLDHIADYLQFISNAQSFWFELNTSMTMATTSSVDSVWTHKTTRLCRLSSHRPGVVLSCQLVVALPLVVLSLRLPLIILSHQLVVASIALPSRCLVAPAGCRIASHRPLVVPPSRQLVAPACCCITSPRPLVGPRAALSSSCRTGWLLRCLSTRRPLVILSSRHVASCCLVAPAGCHAIISCCPVVLAPPSHPLIVLAGCCIACPCTALLSSRCSPLPTLSNAVERHPHRRH